MPCVSRLASRTSLARHGRANHLINSLRPPDGGRITLIQQPRRTQPCTCPELDLLALWLLSVLVLVLILLGLLVALKTHGLFPSFARRRLTTEGLQEATRQVNVRENLRPHPSPNSGPHG